jgi:cysteine desulfurase / selenocysteine lyase
MNAPVSVAHGATALRDRWVGLDIEVPVAVGHPLPYANLDNTASTPPLRVVRDRVDGFMDWYSSVHRGAGFKSQVSTVAYEDARDVVGRFVKADDARDRVVFTKHTTESVNILAAAFGPSDAERVAVSLMEHHSNMLPWRRLGPVDYIEVDDNGRLRLDSLEDVLRRGDGHVRLVALNAASNVTGYLNPVHEAARLAHAHGARVVVDAAQLAAHRAIDMRSHQDPEHLDFVVFSGHKIYAPYGAGVLVGDAAVLDRGEPLLAGGGAVQIVTRDSVMWDRAPERDEAGSPNVVGAVALAIALQAVEEIGFDTVEAVETSLTDRALRGLEAIDGVRLLGAPRSDGLDHRLGVMAFTLEGRHHALVATVLSNEWAVGVRDGCFCAHPYLMNLLRIGDAGIERTRTAIEHGDKRAVPGAVRASVAPYNTDAEIDRFIAGVEAISRGEIRSGYVQDRGSGAFGSVDWTPDWRAAFSVVERGSEGHR